MKIYQKGRKSGCNIFLFIVRLLLVMIVIVLVIHFVKFMFYWFIMPIKRKSNLHKWCQENMLIYRNIIIVEDKMNNIFAFNYNKSIDYRLKINVCVCVCVCVSFKYS